MTRPSSRVPGSVILGRPYTTPRTRTLTVHPDKAISQRATVLAALAYGTSRVRHLADCEDTRSNLVALRTLGCRVVQDRDEAWVTGRRWRDIRVDTVVDAGNSATTARLLLAVLATSGSRVEVRGNASLSARPMSWLVDPLRQMGADLAYVGTPGRLPVRVTGQPLTGAEVKVEVDSAQPVSALAMAAVGAEGPTVIHRRTPARDHTERLLRWTGIRVEESPSRVEVTPGRPAAFDLCIPGDPSCAAVLVALRLATTATDVEVVLPGVCLNPRRLGFLEVLRALGAQVSWAVAPAAGPEPVGDVHVRPGRLDGGVVGGPELVQAMVDEMPLLAALATTAAAPVIVRDARELRDKDTDRLAGTVRLLHAFGSQAHETEDGFVVYPSRPRPPARVDLPADHRLVFAGCVLALLAGGEIRLDGLAAAATSYPGLVADLAQFAPVEVL